MAGNILIHRGWVQIENPSCGGQPGRMDGDMSQSGGEEGTPALDTRRDMEDGAGAAGRASH